MESELTFVAPEGVYSVTEEHKPTTLNPHFTITTPSLYPTRVSTAVVRFPVISTKPSSGIGTPGLAQLLGGGKNSSRDKDKEKPDANKLTVENDGKSLSSSDNAGTDDDVNGGGSGQDGAFGTSPQNNSPHMPHQDSAPPNLFSQTTQIGGKKKSVSRPKHNIRTTTSTFVTRLQTMEGLSKLLQAKTGDVTFMFYNQGKNFFWTEVGSKPKEPFARITFAAYPTCHSVNTSTASSERLDVVIGFNTGDLIWFDPISGRYVRLNKQGSINNSLCTGVSWVPSSPSLFLVSHADGTIIVYDKERDDGAFTPQDPGTVPQSAGLSLPSPLPGPASHSESSSTSIPSDESPATGNEWNPLDSIFVTMPRWHPVSAQTSRTEKEKDKMPKNPVSHWRVSRRAVLNLAFSPDVTHVAAISEDGCLRVINALAEQLVDCYASYFGSFTCVAWSPDGRLIITGGQDDLVTIFSPFEQRVIARCQGHSSFVSAVAFDDLRCDGRTYRFGSVGEDNKLILWDFSSGSLHRPKLQASVQQRMSMSSSLSLALRRRPDTVEGSTLHLPPTALSGTEGTPLRYHPAPSRNEVAVVQPVLVKHIEGELLTDLLFTSNAVLTTSKAGVTKLWVRPLALKPKSTKNHKA